MLSLTYIKLVKRLTRQVWGCQQMMVMMKRRRLLRKHLHQRDTKFGYEFRLILGYKKLNRKNVISYNVSRKFILNSIIDSFYKYDTF